MAGIIGIYGLVVSVLISNGLKQEASLFTSFIQLGAGLSVGLSGMAAGFAIGIVGDAGVRGTAQQPRLFVGMILILIFAEVLGTCIQVAKTVANANRYRRSVRSHCCPAHELQGCYRYLRRLRSSQPTTIYLHRTNIGSTLARHVYHTITPCMALTKSMRGMLYVYLLCIFLAVSSHTPGT